MENTGQAAQSQAQASRVSGLDDLPAEAAITDRTLGKRVS